VQPYRRRGLAAAITARLTRDAFAAGVTTAFLTPGDDGAHRVYERAGFVDTTVMLHLARRKV
jgi:predicted GNAT family acetyltransferase